MKNHTLPWDGMPLPLWGLVDQEHEASNDPVNLDGRLLNKIFFDENGQVYEGPLFFTSPLDAEIYCQRLHALGKRSWRRCRLDDSSVARALADMHCSELILMIASCFIASEMQEILLDDVCSFATPTIALQVQIEQYPGKLPFIKFEPHTSTLMHALMLNCWTALGAGDYTEKLALMCSWNKEELTHRAAEAISKVTTIEDRDCHDLRLGESSAEQLAVFDPLARQWCFGTINVALQCTLH